MRCLTGLAGVDSTSGVKSSSIAVDCFSSPLFPFSSTALCVVSFDFRWLHFDKSDTFLRYSTPFCDRTTVSHPDFCTTLNGSLWKFDSHLNDRTFLFNSTSSPTSMLDVLFLNPNTLFRVVLATYLLQLVIFLSMYSLNYRNLCLHYTIL